MFNGYKTYIGLIVYGVGSVIQVYVDPQLGSLLMDLGKTIAGIGAIHKFVKANS